MHGMLITEVINFEVQVLQHEELNGSGTKFMQFAYK